MKCVIHVNQHKIKSNSKHGKFDPVLTIKTYKSNEYAHSALLIDKSGHLIGRVVYRPHHPLSCGAKVWIEFDTDQIAVIPVIDERMAIAGDCPLDALLEPPSETV